MFILLRKQSGSPLPTQNFQNGGNHCGGGLGGMQTLGEQIMLHNSFGGITSILGCRVGLLTDRSNFTNKSCTCPTSIILVLFMSGIIYVAARH